MAEINHFTHFWDNANLDEDYWSIVGIATESDYALVARQKYVFLKRLGFNNSHKILDVGCGTGILPYAIQYDFVGQYLGCDIHQKAIDFCRKTYQQEYFSFDIVSNNDIAKFGGGYDFIVFYSVFTHIMSEDILKYLKQALNMLNYNGVICCDLFLGNEEFRDVESSIISYQAFVSILSELKCSLHIIKKEVTVYKDRKFDRFLLEMRKI